MDKPDRVVRGNVIPIGGGGQPLLY